MRIIGEPKRANPAIIRTSEEAGMHLQTVSRRYNFLEIIIFEYI